MRKEKEIRLCSSPADPSAAILPRDLNVQNLNMLGHAKRWTCPDMLSPNYEGADVHVERSTCLSMSNRSTCQITC